MRAAVPLMLACGVTLSACGGNDQPAAPPEPEDARTTATATASPDEETATAEPAEETETASPTEDENAHPEMPEEAEENTEAGAEAFAHFFMGVFNALSQDPQAGSLTDLSQEGCETCKALQGSLDEMADERHRADGPVVEVLGASAVVTNGQADVSLDIRELGPAIVDADGKTVLETQDPADSQLVLLLEHGEEGWEVAEIQAPAS